MKAVKAMQIRQHRGGLEESVATMETISATMEAVRDYIQAHTPFMFALTETELKSVEVKIYSVLREKRIPNWIGPTYVITYLRDGENQPSVFGFCSDMPEEGEGKEITATPEISLIPESVDEILGRAREFTQQTVNRKGREQKYIEQFLTGVAASMPSGNEFILGCVLATMVSQPAFHEWLRTPLMSQEKKKAFEDIEYALDITRFFFKTIIPLWRHSPSYIQAYFGNWSYPGYCIKVDTSDPKDYFIYLTDGEHRVALYNGN